MYSTVYSRVHKKRGKQVEATWIVLNEADDFTYFIYRKHGADSAS